MQDFFQLPDLDEIDFIKSKFPAPIAYKINEIKQLDNPAAIYKGILDSFEFFLILLRELMLSQFFYDKIDNPDLLKGDIIKLFSDLEQNTFGKEFTKIIEILKKYEKNTKSLAIPELFPLYFKQNQRYEFISQFIKKVKKWECFDNEKKIIDFKETDSLQNLTVLFMALRNYYSHTPSKPTDKDLSIYIKDIWITFIKFVASFKFFENYSIASLTSTRIDKKISHSMFKVFSGNNISSPSKMLYSTDDDDFIQALQIDNVYLGKIISVKEHEKQFRPLLSLFPLLLFKNCNCDICKGQSTIFYAIQIKKSEIVYKGSVCGTNLQLVEVKNKIEEFLKLLWSDKINKNDMKTFQKISFHHEKAKSEYRDLLLIALKDGNIVEEERKYLNSLGKELGLSKKECIEIEEQVQNNDDVKHNIEKYLENEKNIQKLKYENIFEMVMSDGALLEVEREELKTKQMELDLSDEEVNTIEDRVLRKDKIINRINNYNKLQKTISENILKDLFEIAILNHNYSLSKNQNEYLLSKATEFGFTNKEILLIKNNVLEKHNIIKNGQISKNHIKNEIIRAKDLIEENDLENARIILNKLLFMDKENYKIYKYLGLIMLMNENYETSIKLFINAMIYNKDDDLLFYYLAKSFYKINNYDMALNLAKNALSLNDKSADNYILLAHIMYYYTDQHEEAIKILEKGLNTLSIKEKEKVNEKLGEIN